MVLVVVCWWYGKGEIAVVHGSTGEVTPTPICRRACTLLYISKTLVAGSTPPALIRCKVCTLLHIRVALVEGCRECAHR